MYSDSTYQPVDLHKAKIQPVNLPEYASAGVTADVLRLDLIHPVISGNKWFKLKYHLKAALDGHFKGLLSFGGAWSNHLVATAAAANAAGLPSVGVVRGERSQILTPALQDAENAGMVLQFVNRSEYKDEESMQQRMQELYPGHYLVPQGGQGAAGVQGAKEIWQLVPAPGKYTHIACALGTGTMMAGLAEAITPRQQVLGFSALKLGNTSENSLTAFLRSHTTKQSYQFMYDYHFGGFARKNQQLTDFMLAFYRQTGIPSDIVYTGKLFYGITDLVQKNFFRPGSQLLLIHSGGLQGNRSLPPDLLPY